MPFKDTEEGQTHYQNDGCGIKEHNQFVVKESCGKMAMMSDGIKRPCLITKPCWKHENNYESKGGYCAVHIGLLDNGACIEAEKHEKKLNELLASSRLAGIKECLEAINRLPVYYRSKFSASNLDSDGVEMLLLEQVREIIGEAIKNLKEKDD